MKLFEIFDTEVRDVNLNRKFDTRKARSYDDELGSGNFSRVRQDNDPHQVKKSQTVSNLVWGDDGSKDGFVLFANAVAKHKLWNKIHFPRLYVSKKFKDDDGRVLYQWKMEKLEPLMSLRPEELYGMLDRYFVDTSYIEEDLSSIRLANEIALEIGAALKHSNALNVADETLKEALAILRKLYMDLKRQPDIDIRTDLHAANMMARRTSVGLQLVITDPFA